MSRLKTDAIRNVNASVDGITLDTSGNVAIPNELQLADKIIHTGDTDTSIRFPSSNTITFDTGGSKRIELDSSGNLLINATTTFSGATKLQVRGASSVISDGGQIFDVATTAVATGGTRLAFGVNEDNYSWIRSYESAVGARDLVFAGSGELLRITSDGKVAIGFNAPAVAGLSIANGSTSLGFEFDTGSGFSGGPTIRGYYRPGSAYKSLGITVSDIKFGINDVEKARIDSSGILKCGGWTDSNSWGAKLHVGTGYIAVDQGSGSPWIFGKNSADQDFILGRVAADGTKTEQFRAYANGNLRIGDGDLVIGTSGHGIDFSAQTASTSGSVASELLDHYEEGSCVMSYTPASGAFGGMIYTSGKYTKIGNIVTVIGAISLNGAGTASGGVRITGWPFVPRGLNSTWSLESGHGIIRGQYGYPKEFNMIVMNNGGTNAYIYKDDGTELNVTNCSTGYNENQCSFTVTFMTDT